RVEIAVGVEPDCAPGAVARSKTAKCSESDGVVAAEDDRKAAVGHGCRDPLGHSGAGFLDLRKEARVRIATLGRLRCCGANVAQVLAFEPESQEALVEPRVTDRRRAHVHPSAARAEIQGSPDDRKLSFLHGEGRLNHFLTVPSSFEVRHSPSRAVFYRRLVPGYTDAPRAR